MKLDYRIRHKTLSFKTYRKYIRHVGLGGLGILCLILSTSGIFKKAPVLTHTQEPIAIPTTTMAAAELVSENPIQAAQTTTPSITHLPATPKPPIAQPEIKQEPSALVDSKPELTEKSNNIESTKKLVGKQLAFSTGAIRKSLVSSGKKAGLNHKVINQMVEILSAKIDFSTDLRPNDSFRVLYEQKIVNGEPVETGNILAVEFVNQGEKYQAVRYTDKTGHTGYFSPEGYGLNEAFLRSPVDFVHISSSFGPRKHPIYHKMRQHRGIDYRAPHGTPVKATANAKVIFAGTRGGYGNAIELQHGARYSTLYAHLSRFAKNIKPGTEVKQGQIIGYVGRTGAATGDHLHYEFRIDGIHRNPLTAAMPKQNSIAPGQRPQFIAHAKEMIRLLDIHQTLHTSKIKMASNHCQLSSVAR